MGIDIRQHDDDNIADVLMLASIENAGAPYKNCFYVRGNALRAEQHF